MGEKDADSKTAADGSFFCGLRWKAAKKTEDEEPEWVFEANAVETQHSRRCVLEN